MRFQWLTHFCAWLEQTFLSQTIQTVSWIVPAVQTIHILAIAVLVGSALMMALRTLGRFAVEQPEAEVAARFLPFMWWSLVVLLLSGLVMITGEPARSLANGAFQLKMALLIGAILATRLIHRRMTEDHVRGVAGVTLTRPAVGLAALWMLLWAGIIFAGRWIAYL
jgi:hypothetical protein